MQKEYLVDAESAESEFESWADAMDLDIDQDAMDEEDKSAFSANKRKIIKSIQCGALTFNADGEAVYTPQNKKSKHQEPITFHERTGASLMAVDRAKKGRDVEKTMLMLADMTRLHAKVFADLVGVDIRTCMAIFAFLMD